ncbi:hypothetical protein [Streptomyces sp. S.PB5]|uniref:hypothetical protein n=1 Tax=Streptomyces sp. S.PB5 TaxID=3020844 RepID=UPI0025AF04A5|nr:hypothetical protein [Streptomyces sp. S.PB5]MDN3022806.1 hypothetical protein [Streptomyces sp. S.PB5]
MKRRVRIVVLALSGLMALAGPAVAGVEGGDPVLEAGGSESAGIVQVALSPSGARPGEPVTVRLTVRAPQCTAVRRVGVMVRDGLGRRLELPGGVIEEARVCPEGLTLTAEPHAFRAGTYTLSGYHEDAAGEHELGRARLTVVSGDRSNRQATGRKRVWAEEFDKAPAWGKRWINTGTSAYRYGTHSPDDDKLDWVDRRAVKVTDGRAVFTARPSKHTLENGRRAWDTGLITTEGSRERFRLRTGDYVETRVQLPTAPGAWAAMWTWTDGGGEVDVFEYHPDTPELLEMVNHTRYAANYHPIVVPKTVPGKKGAESGKAARGGGVWLRIGVAMGASSVDWYVDDVLVYQDGRGVGRGWSACLTLSLSVSSGVYHPPPPTEHPFSFAVDYVHVYRAQR